eukprot:TRINITY_DN54206_c0_g1_i1.p1 TRINITY_DN54206_c0_g1~~TRINITY_DN54206_c0_g1_i1.p1  ORF type:complete len:129 (+),score=18.89 TRINITY_DN54206_c0_g1_i1:107-493(+)
MAELGPCVNTAEDPMNCTAATPALRKEIADVLAFRQMLFRLNELPESTASKLPATATSILVALHNMVTETVSGKFAAADRKKYYCVNDVLRYLSRSLVPDAKSKLGVPNFSVPGLPGLSPHRLVNCSV